MRGYFIFDDFISTDIGSLADKPTISRAKRQIKDIEIFGRSGTLTEDYATYDNITIPLRIVTTNKDIWSNETLFNTFNGKGGELKLSWLNGKFKVKQVSEFSITQQKSSYTIEIEFVCEPFRYLDEEVISITTKGTNIFSSGNYEADHITTIYGNGDISLLINNKQIVFKGVSNYITIDTARLICYKDNTPANNKMLGEFLKLNPFVNTIDWIGTVSKVEIRYRGRFLN